MIGLGRHTTAYRSLLTVALLALLGLNGLHLIHYATEDLDEFLDASALYDCFVCTTLISIAGEVAADPWCLEIVAGEPLREIEIVPFVPPVACSCIGARSPPAVSV